MDGRDSWSSGRENLHVGPQALALKKGSVIVPKEDSGSPATDPKRKPK